MKASEKIKGIVFAYNTTGEYDMVKELGVEWMQLGIPFPWTDRMFGTLSDAYIREREEIRRVHAAGFQVMPATPGMGGFTFDPEKNATVWKESYPEFVGPRGSGEFYDNVRQTMKFICEDLGDAAGIYWQCMNEPDIPIFSNDYSHDIIAGTAWATAEGIRLINEAAPSEAVLKIKALEAFAQAANGNATKIIIPSEIQGLAGLAAGVIEAAKEEKK